MLLLCLALAQQQTVDSSQATAVLDLLERSRSAAVSEIDVDRVMALLGTRLVIAQMNVSRRVTEDQYRAVLSSALKGERLQLQASTKDPRAAKGIEGLMADVAPSLIWARDHVAELRDTLNQAAAFDGVDAAIATATSLLPRKVAVDPKLYFVMGGRAGAAALPQGIYIDLLALTWRSPDHQTQLTREQMAEFFAHELHHVAYGSILAQVERGLTFNEREARVWSFLQGLMLEGTATLLINARGDWANIETSPVTSEDATRIAALLPQMQAHLLLCLDPSAAAEDVERSQAQFTGQALHVLGARLLFAILNDKGLDRIKEIMRDPRSLLIESNKVEDAVFHFDPALAARVSKIG